jgi:hypothetical protein
VLTRLDQRLKQLGSERSRVAPPATNCGAAGHSRSLHIGYVAYATEWFDASFLVPDVKPTGMSVCITYTWRLLMKTGSYVSIAVLALALSACGRPPASAKQRTGEARNALNTNPSLYLSHPYEGSTISGRIEISGIASDQDDGDTAAVYFSPPSGNSGEVSHVTMYDEPPLIFIFEWDTHYAANGPAVLTVFAEDDNGGSTTIQRHVIIAN